MPTKTCTNLDCPETNPQSINNFHKHDTIADGHNSRCKTCLRCQQSASYRNQKREMAETVIDDPLQQLLCRAWV